VPALVASTLTTVCGIVTFLCLIICAVFFLLFLLFETVLFQFRFVVRTALGVSSAQYITVSDDDDDDDDDGDGGDGDGDGVCR